MSNNDTKRHRQTVRGVVVSDKMHKTRVIEIKRSIRHTLYHKGLMRKTRLFIHDEKNQSKVGDLVVAIATKPLSRHKHFSLAQVLEAKVAT